MNNSRDLSRWSLLWLYFVLTVHAPVPVPAVLGMLLSFFSSNEKNKESERRICLQCTWYKCRQTILKGVLGTNAKKHSQTRFWIFFHFLGGGKTTLFSLKWGKMDKKKKEWLFSNKKWWNDNLHFPTSKIQTNYWSAVLKSRANHVQEHPTPKIQTNYLSAVFKSWANHPRS